MKEKEIIKFDTVTELQSALKKELDLIQKKSEAYSKLIGEKLRSQQGANTAEFDELKAALEKPQDGKKKPHKKKESTQWKKFDSVLIYDGIGLKGELEIYFQSLEELKSKVEQFKNIVDSVDKLIAQGLKKDLGCLAMVNSDLSFRIAFQTSHAKPKFMYKSIFDVRVERPVEIRI